MIMLVDVTACTVSFDELGRRLANMGEEKGLSIRIQREDIFEAMHRVCPALCVRNSHGSFQALASRVCSNAPRAALETAGLSAAANCASLMKFFCRPKRDSL
jgi:hypothetical protein